MTGVAGLNLIQENIIITSPLPVAHTVTAAGVDPAADTAADTVADTVADTAADTVPVDVGTGYTEDTAASAASQLISAVRAR